MRRVIALELVGLKKLGCDLYNENGKIIYQKETEFTPEIFMQLSHSKIFKRDEEPLTSATEEIPPVKSKNKIHVEDELKKAKSSIVPEVPRSKIQERLRQDEIYKQQEILKQQEFLSKKDHSSQRRSFAEPFNRDEKAEFKSVIDQNSKNILLNGIKEVLHNALNATPMTLQPCFDVTNTILNQVYTKLRGVNRIDELRIHDYYTFTHNLNVAMLSAVIGRELGFNEYELKDLTFSAFLHDVGKMQIPKQILYKPGRLTEEEMQLVRRHSELGYQYLTNTLGLPVELARPALEHHERWEGQGYPQGLKKNQISVFSQIIAIADVYDALVSEKIYRGSVQSVDAMKILLTEEAKSFNPEILNKFVYMSTLKKAETGLTF